MNLILHHLKKDIRCLRLLLLLWFLLLMVNSLAMRSGLDRLILSDEGTEVLAAAYVLLYVLQQILQIVIVCQLVQADALAGTTAFWLTRPISRTELLLSKSLFVLLILVLPSLIGEGIVLQINGISVSQTLSVLLQEIILQSAFFVIPPMLLAALTPNLARLVVTGVASVTAFFLIHYAVLASVMSFGTASRRRMSAVFPGQWPTILSTKPSAMVVSAILTVGLGGMVIIYQYLKRRTLNSGAAAVLGMCLVIATLNFWSWDLLKPRESLPAQSELIPQSLKPVVRREGARFMRGDAGNLTILGQFELQGVPSNFFLVLIGLQGTLQLSSEKVVPFTFDYPLWFFGDEFRLEKEVKVLNEPWPGIGPRAIPLLSVDTETFQDYKDTPGTYSAEARLAAYQRLSTTVPLKTGSRHKGNSGEITLLGIVPNQGTFLTALSNSKRDGFIVTLRESGVRQWLLGTSLTGGSYILRNRDRNEALFGRSDGKDLFGGFPALHRLVVNRSSIYFTTAGIANYQGPVIDEEWLEQAELLRVESRFIGQFSKSVHIESFVMNTR